MVEFRTGQPVPFPAAPDGIAQVEELLRTNVGLLYARDGRLCRRRINAQELARICAQSPLLPCLLDNPLRRGVIRRSKIYRTRTTAAV